jgi:hypothetical protein
VRIVKCDYKGVPQIPSTVITRLSDLLFHVLSSIYHLAM